MSIEDKKKSRKRKQVDSITVSNESHQSNLVSTSKVNALVSTPIIAITSDKYVKYLIKTEPDEYGIDTLINEPTGIGRYDGVRNYQARNHIRMMKSGDLVYFYHSNIKAKSGIYGIIEIVGDIFPDPTSWDPTHKTYDAKCIETDDVTTAKWVAFNMKLVTKWDQPLYLNELKKFVEGDKSSHPLCHMMLFKNSRLSVQLVKESEAEFIHSLVKK